MDANLPPLESAINSIYQLSVGVIGVGKERHERPHKPVLLLSILDGVEEGWAHPEHVNWSTPLRERFFWYFGKVQAANDDPTPENPFVYLRSDRFWTPRQRKSGMEMDLNEKPRASDCDSGDIYGQFSTPWQKLLESKAARSELRKAILSRYFPDRHLEPPTGNSASENKLSDKGVAIRSAAFRRQLIEIYDHQCCACGLRVRIPELSFSLVDAAHLIPFAQSQDDRPRNGICLCKNHHWAMDYSSIAPDENFSWRVLRWTPKTGQGGSLTQTQRKRSHVKKETPAQCPVQSPSRA